MSRQDDYNAMIAEQTRLEMERGANVISEGAARQALAKAFDPTYVDNPDISPEERARRDEYIRRMKIGRGETP